MIKRILILLLVLASALTFTGCDPSGSSMQEMLKAPRSGGDMQEIQDAFTGFAGRKAVLRYPKSGDHRTAFVRCDLDRDGVEEAVAFYSSSDADGVDEVHICLIDLSSDSQWSVVGDIPTGASEIDKVEISALEKNGVPVLMVGTELFSTMGNQLSLFTYVDGKLTVRMQESYTEFLLCDLVSEGYAQLMILNLNAGERTADATLYSVGDDTTGVIGSVSLDGNISTFSAVTVGKLADGRNAVFVDSLKSTSSMITDVVYFDSGKLVNPFFDTGMGETLTTQRDTTSVCTDIDGDSVTEIPFTDVMPGYTSSVAGERIYSTIWRSFDGAKFSTVKVGDFNYTDGYYLTFGQAWQGKITVIYDSKNSMRSYRVWDAGRQTAAEEILRIRVYSAANFKQIDSSSLIVLAETDSKVWVAHIVAEKGNFAIDEQSLKDSFGLL